MKLDCVLGLGNVKGLLLHFATSVTKLITILISLYLKKDRKSLNPKHSYIKNQ